MSFWIMEKLMMAFLSLSNTLSQSLQAVTNLTTTETTPAPVPTPTPRMHRVVDGEAERRRRARERLLLEEEEEEENRQRRQQGLRRRTFVSLGDSNDESSERDLVGSPSRQRDAPAGSPASASPTTSRACRICLGGEEDGELISPCLCRGTSAFVHRECLNNWRRMSQNPTSFWRCDSCRYNYRTVKIHSLDVLKHPLFLTTSSLAILGAAVCALALLLALLPRALRTSVASTLFRALRLAPFWRRGRIFWSKSGVAFRGGRPLPAIVSTALDGAFVSAFLLGVLGFAGVLYLRYRRYRRDEFMRIVAPSLALTTLNVGMGILRLCAVIGLFVIWTFVYQESYQRAQKLIMTHGELVLDISATGGGGGGRGSVRRARMSEVQARLVSLASWLNAFMGIERRHQRHRQGPR